MATATPNRISDEEIQARAKMASFIDRVIETIQSTRRPKRKTQESDPATSSAKNPAKE
jgi:hypothetical protein